MKEETHDRATNAPGRHRSIVFAVFAVGLAVLSAQGALDDFGREVVEDTTNESIGIFFVSRTINATVSTLQSSRVGAGISMQVGVALDPINDAVERLSTAMVWAIGSLLLQRTAVDVASSALFKWGFVLIAVVAVLMLALAERQRSGNKRNLALDRYGGLLVRIFVVAAMFRFFVPVFVASSFLVTQTILQPQIDGHQSELFELYTEAFGEDQPLPDGSAQGAQEPDEPNVQEPVPDHEQGFFGDLLERFSEMSGAARQTLSDLNLPSLPDMDVVLGMAWEFVESSTRLLVYIAIKNVVLPLLFLVIAVKGAAPFARFLIGLGSTGRSASRALSTV